MTHARLRALARRVAALNPDVAGRPGVRAILAGLVEDALLALEPPAIPAVGAVLEARSDTVLRHARGRPAMVLAGDRFRVITVGARLVELVRAESTRRVNGWSVPLDMVWDLFEPST